MILLSTAEAGGESEEAWRITPNLVMPLWLNPQSSGLLCWLVEQPLMTILMLRLSPSGGLYFVANAHVPQDKGRLPGAEVSSDIDQPLVLGSYSHSIVSNGVFTTGHFGSDGFGQVLADSEAIGHLLITVKTDIWHENIPHIFTHFGGAVRSGLLARRILMF